MIGFQSPAAELELAKAVRAADIAAAERYHVARQARAGVRARAAAARSRGASVSKPQPTRPAPASRVGATRQPSG
jgi:hypothetical protein